MHNSGSIEIVQGNSTVSAIPIFVSSGQLNAIMPSNAPLGRVSLRVSFNGEQSNPETVTVVENSVGIFTATGSGIGPGIVQNFVSQTVQPINTTTRTAKPGQVVTMWATGLGPISAPDNTAPPVGTLPFDVAITVGGKAVTNVFYAGRAPCCSGVDQFVFQIPASAPHGCYVPLRVRVAGVAVSNTVTMAIEGDQQRCSEPENPAIETFLSGGTIGVVEMLRTVLEADAGVIAPVAFTFDGAKGYFRQESGGELAFNPHFALPPQGACVAYAVAGDLVRGIPSPYVSSPGLDAGEITLNGPNGAAELERTVVGESTVYNNVTVGGPQGISAETDEPLFFSPGAYQIKGTGGAGVGPIDVNANVSPPLQWTNSGELSEVARGEGVTFEWTPGDSPWVVVAGVSVDKPRNASAMFLCVAPDGASSFHVPAAVLANLPASRPVIGHSQGFLTLGSTAAGEPPVFSAEGLDFGVALSVAIHQKTVRFR